MRVEHKPRLEIVDVAFLVLLVVLVSFSVSIIFGALLWIRFFFL